MLPERGARRGVGRPKTQVLAGPPGVARPALLGGSSALTVTGIDGLLVRTREIGLPAVDRLGHLQTHRTSVDLKRLSAKLGPVIRSLQKRWLCAGGTGGHDCHGTSRRTHEASRSDGCARCHAAQQRPLVRVRVVRTLGTVG
jgi:hypothetical protein